MESTMELRKRIVKDIKKTVVSIQLLHFILEKKKNFSNRKGIEKIGVAL
jgi:hypothetical protein